MKPIDFAAEADAEVQEAFAFWETVHPPRGDAFLRSVQDAADRIRRSPYANPIDVGRERFYILTDFPYTVRYRVLRDRIWIAAVPHHSRRPRYWRGRRPD